MAGRAAATPTPIAAVTGEVRAISGDDDRITILGGAWVYLEDRHGSISFAHEGQDLGLELEIVAVDLDGNRSAPTRVHIVDDEPLGCASGGARTGHMNARRARRAGRAQVPRRRGRRGARSPARLT